MESRHRHFKGALATVVTVVSVALSAYVILYASHAFDWLDRAIQILSHRSIFLAFLVILSFLVLPARKGEARDRLPWYDVLFMLAGIAGPLYNAFFWVGNANRYGLENFYPWELALAVITMVTVLEITRRAVGLAMPLVATFFLLHTFFAPYFPAFLSMKGATLSRASALIVFSAEGIYGTPLGVASTVIMLFILFGNLLFLSPAGPFFINLAMALFGRVRGGPAKVAVVASAAFGSLSGSPMANVAATGVFTIPTMKRIGYRPEFAGAVESTASTGGLIMPPVMGAIAFLMAEWLGIPYWSVCVAAFIPALLYYTAVFMMVDAEAAKLGLRGLPREECPPLGKTLKEGWVSFPPLLVLVFLLAVLQYSAQYAAIFAMLTLIVISLPSKKTRLGPKQFLSVLKGGGQSILSAGNACACAGLIIGALSVSQLGIKLSDVVVTASGGNMLVLLILTAVTSFVLGMGMPSIPSYIMMVIFVAPALLKFGVIPLAAHMFVFYWAMTSFFTPPVAGACFVAAGISGASAMRIGLTAMRLGIIAYIVPFLFVYDPALLLRGSPADITLHFFTAVVGVVLLSWGLAGQALRRANWIERLLFLASGLLLMVPNWVTDIIGLAVGAAVFLPQLRARVLLRSTGS